MKIIFQSISESAISAFGWMLIHSLWQGAFVGLIAAMGLSLLKKKTASSRYNLGVALLGFQVLLSTGTFTLYEYKIQSALPIANSVVAQNTAIALKTSNLHYNLSTISKIQLWLSLHLNELVICWLIGAGILMLRFAGGWIFTEHLRSKARIVMDKEWRARFGVLTNKLNISKSVEFRETARILTPMVIGTFRPVVLIPLGLLTGFPVSQIEAILAHELAHIRRNDYMFNMLQSIVEVVFFFHPVLWWLSERVRTEREHCCDDIALTVCKDKMALARALVQVAEWQSAPPFAMAFASKKPLLLKRISRVLGVAPKADRLRANWPVTMVLLSMLIGGSLYAVGQKKDNVKEKKTTKHVRKHNIDIAEVATIEEAPEPVVDVDQMVESITEPIELALDISTDLFASVQNDSLNKKMEEYQRKMDLLQKQMEPLQTRMEELNLKMENENFEMERFQREMQRLDWKKSKVLETRDDLMEKRSALFDNDSRKGQAKLSDNELEKQVTEFEQQIKATEQQITEFNAQIAAVRKDAESYKTRDPYKSFESEIEEIQVKMDKIGAEMGLQTLGIERLYPAPSQARRARTRVVQGNIARLAPPPPPAPASVAKPAVAPTPRTKPSPPPPPPAKK